MHQCTLGASEQKLKFIQNLGASERSAPQATPGSLEGITSPTRKPKPLVINRWPVIFETKKGGGESDTPVSFLDRAWYLPS